MTFEEAKKLVIMGLSAFPHMQDHDMRQTAILWSKLLADLDCSLAEAALVKVLMTAKFFPTVADIREAADSMKSREGQPPAPEDAWSEVLRNLNPYKAPTWSHPLIGEAVKVLGYRNLCESEHPGWDRKNFFDIYEALMRRNKEERLNQTVIGLVGGHLQVLSGGKINHG
ncbi:MAG TPA: replicative helicase loader/inhibitor [Selenomonadales bacterium]|nr:replicative helicase loader/inhibitor [Selenomonadales bacterium]